MLCYWECLRCASRRNLDIAMSVSDPFLPRHDNAGKAPASCIAIANNIVWCLPTNSQIPFKMSVSRSSGSARAIRRLVRLEPAPNQIFRPQHHVSPFVPTFVNAPRAARSFTTTQRLAIDILPDADKPEGEVKESEPHNVVKEPTPLTDSEYQEKSDRYFEGLLNRLEEMQEEKEGSMDVEYAVSHLILRQVPPLHLLVETDAVSRSSPTDLTLCSHRPVVV